MAAKGNVPKTLVLADRFHWSTLIPPDLSLNLLTPCLLFETFPDLQIVPKWYGYSRESYYCVNSVNQDLLSCNSFDSGEILLHFKLDV
jgi:hypothetical protein